MTPAALQVSSEAVRGSTSPVTAKSPTASVGARLLRGALTYASANFLLKGLNFVLLPLYTRFLSPADYGIISIAETVAATFAVLLSLGLESGVARLYYQYVSDPVLLRRYVSSCLRFGLMWILTAGVGMLIVGGVVLHVVAPNFVVPFYPFIALAIASSMFSQVVQYRLALYQAEQNTRSFALVTIALFALTTSSVVLCVTVMRLGALGMLVGKLVAWGAIAVGALYLLRHWLARPLEWKFVRETLPLSLPLMPHYLMALFLVTADRIILAHYRSLREVGLYSLAYTLGMAMFLVSVSIGQAWQPIYFDVARREGGRDELGKVTSHLAIALITVAILGVEIVPYFTGVLDPQYREIVRVVPWIIASYLLHAFFGLFQLASFAGKKTKFIALASGIAFAINLTLNALWIPRLGMYGAAYATLAGYAVEAMVMYFYAQRTFRLAYQYSRILTALSVFTVAVAISQLGLSATVRATTTLSILVFAAAIIFFGTGKGKQLGVILQRNVFGPSA
jgi:O-antigen/teichoic acid export membrane protein